MKNSIKLAIAVVFAGLFFAATVHWFAIGSDGSTWTKEQVKSVTPIEAKRIFEEEKDKKKKLDYDSEDEYGYVTTLQYTRVRSVFPFTKVKIDTLEATKFVKL